MLQPNYINALKVELLNQQQFREMELNGWEVDEDRLEEVLWNVNENMEALEEYVVPAIPMKIQQAGKTVENPFTKAGKLVARAKNWFPDEPLIVDQKYIVPADVIEGPFEKLSWTPINLGSDQQVKKYLLSIGWKPTEWNIRNGQVTSPKLTDDSFWSLNSDIGQQIALYLKLKHRRSMLEGFKKLIWLDANRKPRISQVISGMTPTFRCTHKGIVNVPGEDAILGLAIRSIFKAPEGYKQLGVDAKSCQLRMLCHYMGDEAYTEAVVNGKKEDGTDIHSVNMYKTGGLLTNRTQAKRFIYGLLFGAGNAKLGAILGGNKHDGERLRAEFMKQLPALQELLDNLERRWEEYGYIVGLDGRKVYPRAKHMLLVYLVQSAEAILMRWVLALLIQWDFFTQFDVKLAGFIHDEFQFHIREDQAELAAQWVCKAFDAASYYLQLTVPAEGDPAIGNNWAETH